MNWKELLKAFIDKLNEALEGKSDEEKKQILAAATDDLPQEARQYLFDRGHSTAETDAEKKAKKLERENERLKQTITDKDAEINKLQETNPDAAAVRKDYEEKLAQKDKDHEKALADEKAKAESATLEAYGDRLAAQLERKGVRPKAAKYEVRDLIEAGRVKVVDGKIRHYKADQSTPWSAPEGKDELEAFAEAHLPSVDPEDLSSNVPGGPGGGQGGNSTPSGSAYFDQLRKDAVAQTGASQDDKSGELIGW